jgi:hypothetical protein
MFDALVHQKGATSSPGAMRRLRAFQRALFAQNSRGHAEDARTMELEGIASVWLPSRGGELDSSDRIPDAIKGYEGVLAALEAFGEPAMCWPGHLHTQSTLE